GPRSGCAPGATLGRAPERRGAGRFMRGETGAASPAFGPTERRREIAGRVRFEHRRMHVALAAYGTRIPEPRGHDIDRLDDPLVHEPLRLRRARLGERLRGEHRPRPGAKVLRAEVLAGDVPEVLVHIFGADRFRVAVVVEIAEDLLSGQRV